MDPIVDGFKNSAQRTVLSLKEDLKGIRTGRASTAIFETLAVEAYGGSTTLKLMELATILTEGPALVTITPFDPSTVQDIERAILKSPLGYSPQVQGTRILVKIPPLTQEQREKLVRLIGQKVEEKRVNVRNQRDEARKKIKAQMEAKEISEDAKFRLEKDIDTASTKVMEEIQSLKDIKEKEIMEV